MIKYEDDVKIVVYYIFCIVKTIHDETQRKRDKIFIGMVLLICIQLFFYRHKAILDYLNASGFSESFDTLKNETHITDFVPDPKQKYAGLLEKKWTSVIRLQKKVKQKEHTQLMVMIVWVD